MTPPQVIVVVGPTASGKSALAVELARKLNAEVLSADSRQVYTGLTIGSGKISKREMRGVRHHLIDVCSPKRIFTAGDFVKHGRRILADCSKRGKPVIICGGTGFYIDALLGRIRLPSVKPNSALRRRLAQKSAAQLFSLLKKKDPVRAAQMDTSSERNNPVRLIRALEVASSRPQTIEEAYTAPPCVWVGISWPKKTLELRIQKRLHARLRGGMLAESKRLHAGGLSYARMRALGLEYRSMAQHLQGKISRKEMEAELLRDISRYSRKQMMYWNRNGDITWLNGPVTISKAIRCLAAQGVRMPGPAQP